MAIIRKFTGMVVVAALISFNMIAQVKNDAIRAFNESVELMKAGEDNVIGSFENCLKVCEQVGDSAEDIRQKVIQVLPGLYYQEAYGYLSADKNIEKAIMASKKTLEIAEKYQNDRIMENTKKLMVQAYSSMASTYYSNKDYDNAISAFDSVLMINPDHLNSIYNKALIFMGQNNTPKFEESIDLYIEKLKAEGDTAKVKQAQDIALDYFRIAGAKAHQANKLDEALDLLNNALKYGSDKNVFYHFAGIYNKQKKFSQAADYAKKGLEMETGSNEDKAKFYWELGTAQVGKGETADACESFKSSMYGAFVQASKAQRTNLKCQ
jgi:tetratricopeptide (TPR) repeat protein